MGQPPQRRANRVLTLSPTTQYELDPRLTDVTQQVPSFFAFTTQKIIDEIEDLYQQITTHPLEKYLTNSIIHRFPLPSSALENSGRANLQNEKNPNSEWAELKSEEDFFKLLMSLKQQYQLQMHMMKLLPEDGIGFVSSKGNRIQILRKRYWKSQSEMKLDQNLILRLFFSFYLRILRQNSHSKQLFHFHAKTGRQLCHIVIANNLSLSSHFTLLFRVIHIDRYGLDHSDKLKLINEDYHGLCMQKNYTLNVDNNRCKALKTAARLYLDELYMRTVREAEDPHIRYQDDTLLPTKMFPVNRVKSKVKN